MFKQTVYSSNSALMQSIANSDKSSINWQRKDRPDGYTEFRNAKGELMAVFKTDFLTK